VGLRREEEHRVDYRVPEPGHAVKPVEHFDPEDLQQADQQSVALAAVCVGPSLAPLRGVSGEGRVESALQPEQTQPLVIRAQVTRGGQLQGTAQGAGGELARRRLREERAPRIPQLQVVPI